MPQTPQGDRHANYWHQAIGPGDWEHLEDRFQNQGLPLAKLVFRYNQTTHFWEAFAPNGPLGQPEFRLLRQSPTWVKV